MEDKVINVDAVKLLLDYVQHNATRQDIESAKKDSSEKIDMVNNNLSDKINNLSNKVDGLENDVKDLKNDIKDLKKSIDSGIKFIKWIGGIIVGIFGLPLLATTAWHFLKVHF